MAEHIAMAFFIVFWKFSCEILIFRLYDIRVVLNLNHF